MSDEGTPKTAPESAHGLIPGSNLLPGKNTIPAGQVQR